MLTGLAHVGLIGAEVELANDSWSSGQSRAFVAAFLPTEIAAVRLVPSGPSSVTAVRFLFGGDFLGTPETMTVRIWDDSAETDDPGAQIFSASYQITSSETVLQEIDLSGENIVVNGVFRVGLEFNHTGVPTIARDDDGNITPNRNFARASPGGWAEAGVLGVTGDWILRAVVEGIGGGRIPNDWNEDSSFNIADAILLLNVLFPGGGALPRLPCGGTNVLSQGNLQMLDHNGDGGVNIADAIDALNRLFVFGSSLHDLGESCTSIIGCTNDCN